MAETRTGGGSPGPSTDAQNQPVIDPTKNVLDLVESAINRQDDLRDAEGEHLREVMALRAKQGDAERDHLRELAALRDQYDDRLRKAEADRINAIRAVDVDAVRQASTIQETRATALAAQVQASAEAMRVQVAAAAQAAATSLAAALDPVQKDIADLRRAQYEAQGSKTSVIERREASGAVYAAIGLGVSILLALIIIATFIITQSSGA